nr:hypothetical protein BHI3_16660 [Bacteriovorax sp. HI3]
MKNLTLSFLMLFLANACSTMEFNTSGREDFSVGARSGSERLIEVEKTKDFYFWGMTPTYAEFNLQDETQGEGVDNPSYVSIEQRYTFKDIFFTFVTLGLYCPATYKVTLLSKGETK